MPTLINLAVKNLLNAGLRTWLNTIILAIVFFIIFFMQGLYNGFQSQMERARISEETGLSQYWYQQFDPLDPLTYNDNHGIIPEDLDPSILTPILIASGIAYPNGKLQPIILKGIDPFQKHLNFPTDKLNENGSTVPAIIGSQMAKRLNLKENDTMVIRLRRSGGAVDAFDVHIVSLFKASAPGIDLGQIWLPLGRMQDLMDSKGRASILVSQHSLEINPKYFQNHWFYKGSDDLLRDTRNLIQSKKSGGYFLYGILMFLAMISLLDTQTLSLFKRRKEIGLFLALGLTQTQVTILFTLEGLLQGLLAILVLILIGAPILYYLQIEGIQFLDMTRFGLAGSNTIYPDFDLMIITMTLVVLMTIVFLTSIWPFRNISKLSPNEAMRGNWV